MSNLYVACELGAEHGRIMLGALHKEELMVSEARTFQHPTHSLEGVLQWDVPGLYQEIVEGVRGIVVQDESIKSISCHSSATDYLLFDAHGSLVAPPIRADEAGGEAGLKKVLSKVSWEELYEETGVQTFHESALCQLAAEKSRRLKRASHLLSVADGFNYLLVGVPRMEKSQASKTQLYNPTAKAWSERLFKVLGVPAKLFPPVISAGTKLGEVRQDIAKQAGLEEARVITTCSHETSAALAALSIADADSWAFLWPGAWSVMGTCLDEPFIHEVSREMSYTNEIGYGDSVGFYKHWIGSWIVEECKRAWVEQDRELGGEVLTHLATSATPFEAFIDPADPRFRVPGDMPQKIQAFCKETNQEIPRKPGPILRCIYESLALLYRKGLLELEYLTGRSLTRLYILGGASNPLLNHFLANALQIPVMVAPAETAAIGNVLVQALALGHIPSVEAAREIAKHSLRLHTINPHAANWLAAYDRFVDLKVP